MATVLKWKVSAQVKREAGQFLIALYHIFNLCHEQGPVTEKTVRVIRVSILLPLIADPTY